MFINPKSAVLTTKPLWVFWTVWFFGLIDISSYIPQFVQQFFPFFYSLWDQTMGMLRKNSGPTSTDWWPSTGWKRRKTWRWWKIDIGMPGPSQRSWLGHQETAKSVSFERTWGDKKGWRPDTKDLGWTLGCSPKSKTSSLILQVPRWFWPNLRRGTVSLGSGPKQFYDSTVEGIKTTTVSTVLLLFATVQCGLFPFVLWKQLGPHDKLSKIVIAKVIQMVNFFFLDSDFTSSLWGGTQLNQVLPLVGARKSSRLALEFYYDICMSNVQFCEFLHVTGKNMNIGKQHKEWKHTK